MTISADNGGPVRARDVLVALAFLAVFLGLYLATAQSRFCGDGIWIFEQIERGFEQHPLYIRLYRLLHLAAPDLGRMQTLLLISQAGAAFGCGASFLILRGLGFSPLRSALGTLLVGTTPAVWFFATTIEFHGVHFGTVAFAALVTLYVPWRRRVLALALSALSLPPAFATHQMIVLLMPGWMLLVGHAAKRQGHPFSWRALLLQVAPALAAGMLLGLSLASLLRGDETTDSRREVGTFLYFSEWRYPLAMAWYGWLKPLAFLAPLALLGLWRARGVRTSWVVLGTLVLPQVVLLIAIYQVPEKGGFFLGPAAFWGALAVMALPPRRGRNLGPRTAGLAALVLVLQASAGLYTVRSFDAHYDPAERIEQVRRALPDGGILISGRDFCPRIEHYVGEVIESSMSDLIQRLQDSGRGPEAILTVVPKRRLDKIPRAVDLAYDATFNGPDFFLSDRGRDAWFDREARPYMEVFERSLYEEHDTTLFEHDSWPMLRIDRRR